MHPTTDADDLPVLKEQERLILAATELLAALTDKEGLSRAGLARRTGKTRGYITQVLEGRNLTLRTLAEFAYRLGHRVVVAAEPLATRADRQPPTFIPLTMERPRRARTTWGTSRRDPVRRDRPVSSLREEVPPEATRALAL